MMTYQSNHQARIKHARTIFHTRVGLSMSELGLSELKSLRKYAENTACYSNRISNELFPTEDFLLICQA